MNPTPATRARILVQGATLQGTCTGYGLTVTRTEHGYDVVHGAGTIACWGADHAEDRIERLLTARLDAEVDDAPRRMHRHDHIDYAAAVQATLARPEGRKLRGVEL